VRDTAHLVGRRILEIRVKACDRDHFGVRLFSCAPPQWVRRMSDYRTNGNHNRHRPVERRTRFKKEEKPWRIQCFGLKR
jgi:hypothetical protein